MKLQKEDEATLYAEFLTQEGWGSMCFEGWALFKNYDNGKWFLHTPQEPHHEITELAAKLLLEQYDLETETLPES